MKFPLVFRSSYEELQRQYDDLNELQTEIILDNRNLRIINGERADQIFDLQEQFKKHQRTTTGTLKGVLPKDRPWEHSSSKNSNSPEA